jgi:glycosyltransferase involved in cell wall biosynthesis
VDVRELNIAKYQGKSGLRYIVSYVRFMMLAFVSCTGRLLQGFVDIVHVHNMPNFIVFAAALPRLVGKKVILDIHDTMIETYAAKFQRNDTGVLSKVLHAILKAEESLSCKLAHRIVCVNHVQKDVLLKRGVPEEKMVILLNVPDPERLKRQQAPAQYSASNGQFNLIYHGTMAKRLGIDLAIRAVAELSETIPDVTFHVIGEGDDLKEFMQLSRDLGAERFVRFSGKSIPFEELVGLLRTMDLGLVPNRRNAATELMLPIKLLECVALGVPVVVPRLKAIEHYFTNGMVTYFEAENRDSLVDALRYAYMNRTLMKEKAKQAARFMDTYKWEKHKLELINLYHDLAKRHQETVKAAV